MPKSIKVVSIGAGNLAHNLIPALDNIGCKIDQVFSRDIKNARKLATKFKAQAIDDLSEITVEAEFYLVMTKDDVIRDVVKALPRLNKKQFLAHTSGQTKTNFLKTRAENYGSFYPLQTFNKKNKTRLASTPILIFGNNPKANRLFRMLARQLSPIVKEANDLERSKYHLAAVLKNNFINHLACLSDEYLLNNKLDPKVLDPISMTTFNNILEHKACQLQTGPARRDDTQVMEKHLKLLKNEHELKELYKVLSSSIKELYHEDS